jgi:uncharacterized protein YbcV (DUF1398 family)
MTNQKQLQHAIEFALANKPAVGGFPFLAECLKQAGVTHNLWSLPSAQSVYVMAGGSIVNQGTPLMTGIAQVPEFNQEALIQALRTDQAGESTFIQFLFAAWQAGVVHYDVDFVARTVTYYGVNKESYTESYPAVEVLQ